MKGTDGFTLVELLVTLAILSLLTVYSLSALSTLRQMNALAARVERQDEVEAVSRLLQESIAGAYPMFRQAADGSQQIAFEGKRDSIMFFAVSNGKRETGGIYEVRIWKSGEGQLLMSRKLVQRGIAEEPEPMVLLAAVAGLTMSYAGCSWGDTGVTAEAWEDSLTLPHMVLVHVDIESDADAQIVVVGHIGGSGCGYQ